MIDGGGINVHFERDKGAGNHLGQSARLRHAAADRWSRRHCEARAVACNDTTTTFDCTTMSPAYASREQDILSTHNSTAMVTSLPWSNADL